MRLLILAVASLSIASLLLYFFGIGSFAFLAPLLLAVEIAGLIAIAAGARAQRALLVSGLFAGCVATLAYDLVRVPLVHSGVPVFKATSYFGTVLLGVGSPNAAAEVAGWAYHLSNGVSFGLMYAALVTRPRALTAIAWGMSLEGAMLLTPYAEVFGYARDAKFVAVTLGSHAVYGAVLWLALAYRNALRNRSMVAGILAVPFALAILAADFHDAYGARLPASPPPYIGSHLYVCWNVPEPDRVAVIWMMKRFADPAAEFHFIEPFEKLRFGTPLDIPEAQIRRRGALSATEVLAVRFADAKSPRIGLLIRTTHLTEITPWMLAGDPDAEDEAVYLRETTTRLCGHALRVSCLDVLFSELDRRYGTR